MINSQEIKIGTCIRMDGKVWVCIDFQHRKPGKGNTVMNTKLKIQNKREFDERSRENNYDLLYKNECQNWRNKINRVKNTAGFPADRLEKIQASFSDFKKEALQRKKAVKTGTASPKEFTDWLYQQSNVIVELTEI